jgi:PAS domain S-box-containing protein
MLRQITIARSWPLLVRIVIATLAVAAITAVQLPIEVAIPGEPFLLDFVVVVASTVALGRIPGFFAVAVSTIASVLFFEPVFYLGVKHAVDILAIEAYAIVSAASVEAFSRLVDTALAEQSEASSARVQSEEAQTRLEAIEFMARNLAESEARFRATFENAAVGISHFTPGGRWLRVNEAMGRILGWPAEELVDMSFQEITHRDDVATELALIEKLRHGEIDNYSLDKRSLRKDGATVWIRRTVSTVRKSDGSIDYLVSVVEDISARKHAEEELRKSEERFKSSLINAPVPVLLFDDQQEILAVSQSWLDESGYSRDELRRVEDWTARAYNENFREVQDYIDQIVARELKGSSIERTIRTKDGRDRLWTFVYSSLGTQSDGRQLYVCTAYDVTERKLHEEQIQLLMHEARHRVKNILSLVQAIAQQTAARDPEHFIESFTDRIRALAANQDLLVRSDWKGADLADLVRAQLAHLADFESRIAVHGPKLRLNSAAAQTLGLALHELATNAGKYGALSTDKGQVDVCWSHADDSFAMNWTEHDGPPVRRPTRRGFGTTVIDSMARRSLGGEVELDYAPSGLVWRLTCPAANALEGPPDVHGAGDDGA